MAVTYTTYQIPGNFTTANSVTVGPDSNIWFTVPISSPFATQPGAIGMLNLSTGTITEYPTMSSATGGTPSSIVSGPGGDLWFVDQIVVAGRNTSNIASINPTTGVINEYPITIPGATPAGLAVGSDGNLWFTDSANNAVGVFNPTTHTSTEFALPSGAADPGAITSGPDGNLWFTAYLPSVFDHVIADINPTTDAITFSVLPNINAVPLSITAGPDGTVWFTEQFGSNEFTGTYKIASISTTTHAITDYASADGSVDGITTGPDSNIWYDAVSSSDDTVDSTLNQLNPTTQVSSSTPLPVSPVSGPTIVTGPDGNLYLATEGYIVAAQIVPANQAGLNGTVTEDATGTGTSLQPLANQTVYIDLNHDGKIDPGDPTTITNGLGDYSFSGLAPGTYTVSVAPYPGTIVTFPTAGSQTITVAGGQAGTVGALGVIPSSSLLPLTYSATLFGTGNTDVQTAEVNALYRSILGRAPDPTGGANAIAYLKSGGSVGQLAGDLLTSTEYDGDSVQSFYQNYLDRAPTTTELNAGITFLQGGGTQDQLAAQLFDSAEFNTLFATNTAFVQQLYIDILGREPAGTELSNWLSMLSTGTTRPEVVTDLITSTESDQRAVSGQFDIIFGNSSAISNNQPSGSTYVSLLQNGLTQIEMAVSLYSELAFITRANATVS
jgi:virginiamycin B lyase